MATYAIDIRPRARRSLNQLDPAVRKAVAQTIDALSADLGLRVRPRSRGTGRICVSVQGTTGSSMPLMTRHVSSPSPLSAIAARSTGGWSCNTVSMPPAGNSGSGIDAAVWSRSWSS